ncbi:ABC transporter ATP-binding protein [Brevibacillus reuszeri]|uniref:ABC transporter ATP-binding protein n=1 Tax=Brevibacillus reuszeri TaxID=54915 RepID=UPI00366C5244
MLKVDGVCKSYKKGGWFSNARQQVLYDISFEWKTGECLGIIGESGSGKSTLGRLLLGLEKTDRGSIMLDGKSVSDSRTRRGGISAVFQDYTSSINPFYTVEQAMLEPLMLAKEKPELRKSKMEHLLVQVGLDASYLPKYPHELSGGEAQRVCIARALSTEPTCIVMDEAISSLDGSVQVQVLELLKSLRDTHGMGYIFITHDIQAAAYVCDKVMIVRNGRIEEFVDVERLGSVQSFYAKELLRKIMV